MMEAYGSNIDSFGDHPTQEKSQNQKHASTPKKWGVRDFAP